MNKMEKILFENCNNTENYTIICQSIKDAAASKGVEVEITSNEIYFFYTQEQIDSDWDKSEGSRDVILEIAFDNLSTFSLTAA